MILWKTSLKVYSNLTLARLQMFSMGLASYADILWARHAICLPHERLLKRLGTFLTLCSKRSAGEHVEITEEPIGTGLLFNRKPIIRCDRTTPYFELSRTMAYTIRDTVNIFAHKELN